MKHVDPFPIFWLIFSVIIFRHYFVHFCLFFPGVPQVGSFPLILVDAFGLWLRDGREFDSSIDELPYYGVRN